MQSLQFLLLIFFLIRFESYFSPSALTDFTLK